MQDSIKWGCLSDNGIVIELSPITSRQEFVEHKWELAEVIRAANPGWETSEGFYYRGTSEGAPLGGFCADYSPRELFERCHACPGSTSGVPMPDYDFWWMMRHYGINGMNILDWTQTPEIAMWFAIHNSDRSLRQHQDAVLWAWSVQPDDRGRAKAGDSASDGGECFRSYIEFENWKQYETTDLVIDCNEYERSTQQDAIGVRLKTLYDAEHKTWRTYGMDEDETFSRRLLKIPIRGDYEHIEDELRVWLQEDVRSRQSFALYLGLDEGPSMILPKHVVAAVNQEFEKRRK